MHKYALVVIDMQRGFLDPSSPLYIAGAADTVPACARAIDGFVQYHLGLAWEGNYFRRV